MKTLLTTILIAVASLAGSGAALAANYGDSYPAATYNPDRNEFLSTYESTDASYAVESLKAARFDGSGTPIGAAFDVVPGDGNLATYYGSRVVYNPTTSTYTVLYVVYNSPDYEVYLHTLSGTSGAPVGVRKLVGIGTYPAFAYDVSTKLYLVVFSDPTGNGTIYGQYLNDDLTFHGAQFTIVSEPNGPFYYIELAASGTGTFVGVSTNGYNALYTTEYFTIAAGSTATVTPTLIATGETSPRITKGPTPSEFWIADSINAGPYTMNLRKLILPSTLGAVSTVLGNGTFSPGPSLAYNAFTNGYLAVYGNPSTAGKGRFLQADGTAAAAEFPIETVVGYEGMTVAASSRCGSYVAAWLTTSGSQNIVHFGAYGGACSPKVQATSSILDFGSHNVGESATATATFAVELAAVTPAAPTITGVGATAFSIAADGCGGVAIAEHASCSVTVAFTPSGAGTYAATLTLPGTAGSVALSGTATTAPAAVVPPFPISLSSPDSGQTGINPQRALMIWKKAAEKAVTYRVYVCANSTFAGCSPSAPNQKP